MSVALDANLFSANAAGVAPAGLLNSVAPITDTADGGMNATIGDLGAITAVIFPVSGMDIAIICAPGNAVSLALIGTLRLAAGAADRAVPAADGTAPDVLADILRSAIEECVDQRVLDRVLRQERRIRRESIKRFGNAGLCP